MTDGINRFMKTVFEASNSIEGNLVKNILEREGLDAYIQGEYLQGGMGELPAMGLIRIIVEDTDQLRAEKIIRDWEQGAYSL